MIHKKLHLKFIWFIVFCVGISFFSTAQRVLTIEEALDIAEEHNPNMKTSKLNLERTQFMLDAQYAGLRPQFSLNLNPFSYNQSRSFDNRFTDWYTSRNTSSSGTFRASIPILPTDGTLALTNTFGWAEGWSKLDNDADAKNNKAFSNNLRLQLDQPLFTYNRLKVQFRVLELDYENAGISYALQRLTTEQRITSQFYSVYMALSNLEISQAELKNAETNYEIVTYRVNADLVNKEELYQAEVNLLQAQSSVEQYTVSLNYSKDQLKQTLGMSLDEDITVSVNIEANPLLIDQEEAIQHGLNSRLELRQREIMMEREEMTMLSVKAINEFSGNVRLAIGVMGDNERFANIYDQPTNSPSVNITFSVPIFDWGQRKARIQAQKTSQTIAQLNYDEEIVGIDLAIRQSIRSLANNITQIEIQKKNVDNSQRTYELQQIRFREGDLTGLQMSQYQAQVSSARSALARQQISYKTELLTLKVLTLYDYEKDAAVVPVRELTKKTTK